jgi:hypothetical protein
VSQRTLEAFLLAAIMLAVALGGKVWLTEAATFHGTTVAVLVAIGVLIVAAFRRTFPAGGTRARVYATRDAAFLAAIAGAIAFVLSPARWSLGSTLAAVEFGLAVEVLVRFIPAAP